MIRNRLAVLAVAVAGSALVAAAGPAGASPATAGPPPTGHWARAHKVPGLGKLGTGSNTSVTVIACGAPGDCAAGGAYADRAGGSQSFLINEQAGRWGNAVQAPKPDPASTSSGINGLSCSPHGGCVAVGSFSTPGLLDRGFIATQSKGRWDGTIAVSGTQIFSDALTVSCASHDNCVAGGFVFSSPENGVQVPFVMDETNGTWGPPQTDFGLDKLNGVSGLIDSVSCAAPAECAASGSFRGASGPSQTFVVDETDGHWGQAQVLPGLSKIKATSSFAAKVSCAAPGECTLAGTYTDDQAEAQQQLYVADEIKGRWRSPQQVPGSGKLNKSHLVAVNGLACAAAGNCVAAGFITDKSGFRNAVLAEEKNGTWQPVREPADARPVSEATSVACVSTGNCVVTGYANFNEITQAFTVNETGGTWGTAQQLPGVAALNAGKLVLSSQVACAAAGACSLGGVYVDGHSNAEGFLDEESPATTTSLKLSAAKIRFGHEQAETLSVTVRPRTGGTPGGQAVITAGKTRLCVVKLKAGKGSCKLGAKQLKPGSHQLTASYGGSGTYGRSASAASKLTVTK